MKGLGDGSAYQDDADHQGGLRVGDPEPPGQRERLADQPLAQAERESEEQGRPQQRDRHVPPIHLVVHGEPGDQSDQHPPDHVVPHRRGDDHHAHPGLEQAQVHEDPRDDRDGRDGDGRGQEQGEDGAGDPLADETRWDPPAKGESQDEREEEPPGPDGEDGPPRSPDHPEPGLEPGEQDEEDHTDPAHHVQKVALEGARGEEGREAAGPELSEQGGPEYDARHQLPHDRGDTEPKSQLSAQQCRGDEHEDFGEEDEQLVFGHEGVLTMRWIGSVSGKPYLTAAREAAFRSSLRNRAPLASVLAPHLRQTNACSSSQ